jgi:hypothetical protein
VQAGTKRESAACQFLSSADGMAGCQQLLGKGVSVI